MKYYHSSPVLYEKGFSIIINDVAVPTEDSTLYYFDYDQRSQSVNMEFPHFHIFGWYGEIFQEGLLNLSGYTLFFFGVF